MSRVTLLLGAGASVEAGLPTMAGLIDTFKASIKDDGRLTSALASVVEGLHRHTEESSGHPTLDLELLIEALEFLETRDQSIAAAFVHNWRSDIKPHLATISELRRRLYLHLRTELDVDPSSVGYLMPLAGLASELDGIDIFTLNYDAAVEIVADHAGLLHTDGFDTYWNPALFDQQDRYPIRLFKLHGSLLWYETGRARQFTKIALRPGDFPETGAHVSGGSLTSLLIYPGPNKELYAEPYASLLERFRIALRDTKVLIVLGCSLRDAHVRRAILEAMGVSGDLRVVVVDPDAASVLEASDRLFPDGPQFRDFRDLLITEPRETGDALAERVPLLASVGCEMVSEARATFEQSKRTQEPPTQAEHLGTLLTRAVEHGHWGTVTTLLADESPTIVADMAFRLFERLGMAIGSSSFILALLAVGRTDDPGRGAACAAIKRAMVELSQYGWVRSGKDLNLVVPERMSVDSMSQIMTREGAQHLFSARLQEVESAGRALRDAFGRVQYFFEPEDLRSFELISAQVDGLINYFQEAIASPEHAMVGRIGHGQTIPAASEDARERLGEALSPEPGLVGPCSS